MRLPTFVHDTTLLRLTFSASLYGVGDRGGCVRERGRVTGVLEVRAVLFFFVQSMQGKIIVKFNIYSPCASSPILYLPDLRRRASADG